MTNSESSKIVVILVEAINRGDIESAIECYEPDAKYMSESGKTAIGICSIRKILENFIRIKPKLVASVDKLIGGEDFIVCFSHWKLLEFFINEKFVNVEGHSIKVLRKQPDENWRISRESIFV